MSTGTDRRVSHEREKAREEGWNSTRHTKLKEYNALFDPNMRHFFETPSVQGHLLKTGQVRCGQQAEHRTISKPFWYIRTPVWKSRWCY